MGILDDIFDSGAKGVSGATTQIVSAYSQKDEKNENKYGLSGSTRHLCPLSHSDEPDTSHQSNTLRERITGMLASGPKPYEEILAAVGGNEDALREAIRGWGELVSATTGETTLWEIRRETHGDAPSCPDEGSSEAPLPRGDESPLPARFRVGDSVRFVYKRALDVLGGIIIESRWYPAPIRAWWHRIQSGEWKIWISESHVQQGGSNATHG